MKTRRIGGLLVALCLGLVFSAGAQSRSRINVKGIVVEARGGRPIGQATVRLLSIRDSLLITGAPSHDDGSFLIPDVKPGRYIVGVTFIGYRPMYSEMEVTGKLNPVDLGRLRLSEMPEHLGGVVVKARAPEMQIKNDTLEYNAASYKVVEGAVLEDLLKKMPGVQIADDGTVSVNGQQIKKILVDGKEFFSSDPKVATKNLPASIVDKLQVYDEKSDLAKLTGFDDGDDETVLNLTIKKGMKKGLFGNAYAGYGSKGRYEGNFMVNRFTGNDQYSLIGGLNNTNNMGFTDIASSMFSGMGGRGGGLRSRGGGAGSGTGITKSGNLGLNFAKTFSKKLSLNGNIRYSHSHNNLDGYSTEVKTQTNDSLQLEQDYSASAKKSDNMGADFRLEWKPDSMTNILFRPHLTLSRSTGLSAENYTTYQGEAADVMHPDTSQMSPLNRGASLTADRAHGYNLNGILGISRRLNDRGRTLALYLTGGTNQALQDGNAYSDAYYYYNRRDSVIDQQYNYNNKGYNFGATVSWVEPLGRNYFMQLSYRYNRSHSEALKNTYSPDDAGIYNRLDTAYSNSSRSNFTTQRATLAFQSLRPKYNYSLGINIDPSTNEMLTYTGDLVKSDLKRSVVNFSPMARFNYRFSRTTNLRVNYSGASSQPTMQQMQDVPDVSNPNNTIQGNPDLDPYYTNNLSIRFLHFIPQRQTSFVVSAGGSYVLKAVVTDVHNLPGGRKYTSYRNTDGNYNGDLRLMFNLPLADKRFSINSMSMGSYANSNSFIDGEKNIYGSTVLSERAGLNFRSDYLDLGVTGNIRYNKADYSLQPANNVETCDYGIGGNASIYLPWNLRIESDITWSGNSGYQAGYQKNETLWNAAISKSFLRGNAATIRLKFYDILQQRSGISQQTTSNGYTFSSYNTLGSYFMLHFIYRFQIFKGGASRRDAFGRRGFRERGEGRGGFGGRGEGRRF
ncbi:MAG: TonB-dependent receptor [Tannerella sp.]|nr:TonB-dependent receptor [Tannerella sp.]